jgi:adenine-specific DNA-methyltransferase
MNSLLEKEGMAGQVQMVYIDPPYGIKYGSNFQPFVNKRDVKDGKDEDLTQEPEMIRAFRDTWELGIHSYLTYLRDRLLLARELLHESGSCFVQISDENLHHVREIVEDVFSPASFVGLITFRKTTGAGSPAIGTKTIPKTNDYLLWYSRDIAKVKYRQLYLERVGEGWVNYDYVRMPDGSFRRMTREQRETWSLLPKGSSVYRRDNLTSTSAAGPAAGPFQFDGTSYSPYPGGWKTSREGLARLALAQRLEAYGKTLSYRRYADDFPFFRLTNLWDDTLTGGYEEERYFVVQTITKVIQRCLLMTTDPGDLVLDPTCGSGTTADVAEQWGRRWITCDTSRVAITLAKQRLMTAEFDYYELAHPEEGVGSGFRYKTAPHITLKCIANNPEIGEGMTLEQIDAAIARYADQETLYDEPHTDKSRVRVTGPFTVEAVPAPSVQSLDDIDMGNTRAKDQESLADFRDVATPLLDASVARKGPTLRHTEWRDELLKTGLRGKGGHHIDFARIEPSSRAT